MSNEQYVIGSSTDGKVSFSHETVQEFQPKTEQSLHALGGFLLRAIISSGCAILDVRQSCQEDLQPARLLRDTQPNTPAHSAQSTLAKIRQGDGWLAMSVRWKASLQRSGGAKTCFDTKRTICYAQATSQYVATRNEPAYHCRLQ